VTKLDQVMQALKNADEAGNVEDAQRLAQIADKLRRQKQAAPQTGGAIPFIGKGIAESIGFPVDVVTGALNLAPGVDIKRPIGGSEG